MRNNLLVSEDGGATFDSVPFSPEQFFATALTVEPASGAVFVASQFGRVGRFHHPDVWRWSDLPVPVMISTLAVDSQGRLWAGTEGAGFFLSLDHGETWQKDTARLGGAIVRQLVFDPARPETMLLATRGGLYRSEDEGVSWRDFWSSIPDPSIHDLASDPARPERMYAATQNQGIWESDDGGGTWHPAHDGRLAFTPRALALSADGQWLFLLAGERIWRSSDRGRTWQLSLHKSPRPGSGIASLRAHPLDARRLYGVFNESSDVFPDPSSLVVSPDAGGRWEDLDLVAPPHHRLVDVAIDPSSANTLWAFTWNRGFGGDSALFRSDDGGATWRAQSFGAGIGNVVELAADVRRPQSLYAAAGRQGLWISRDGGESWSREALPGLSASVTGVIPDPRQPDRLWVQTEGQGLLDVELTPPLVLGAGRFEVRARWTAHAGTHGTGVPLTLREDTGAFWFFDDQNIEIMIKILDACSFAGRYWVFAGGLTDVEVHLTVDDLVSGERVTYSNPAGRPFQPIQDTASLPCTDGVQTSAARRVVTPATAPPVAAAPSGVVAPSAAELLLGHQRFSVEVEWELTDGTGGIGQPVPLTRDTGAFWFFDGENLELLIKVLDACSFTGRYWVFVGGLTDVETIISVTDTLTGSQKQYRNPAGVAFRPIQDTQAFATCP